MKSRLRVTFGERLTMKRSSYTLIAVVAITVWALAAFAPVTFGASASGGCTAAQLQALKADVSAIHVRSVRLGRTSGNPRVQPSILGARMDALTAVCLG